MAFKNVLFFDLLKERPAQFCERLAEKLSIFLQGCLQINIHLYPVKFLSIQPAFPHLL